MARWLVGLATALVLAVCAPAADSPRRIISASPSITEMLYALGLGDRVVGVTNYCHYPPEVREKPKIGAYLNPSMETIVSMRPDLVVVLAEHGAVVGRLKRLKLNTLELQHNNLDGIYDSLQQLGRQVGVEDRANQVVAEIRDGLAAVARRAEGRELRSAMFVVGRTPGTIADLVIVGRGGFLNELIAIAGGRNAFGDAGSYYPRIPREELYARRPEVIIDMGDMADTDQVTEDHRLSVAGVWRRELPNLPAVVEGRVYPVAEDIFVVPGPRVVEAAEALLEMIHPEAKQ